MHKNMQKRSPADDLLWLGVALAVCLAVEYVSFGLSRIDWSVPLLYGGDGVTGVLSVKEMLQGGRPQRLALL